MQKDDQLLAFIKEKGPIIPSQATSTIGTNILFTSAILSDLASKGLVKISNVKIGGSPLYYLPGQEADLEKHMEYLGAKRKEAVLLLKERGILKDSELDPVSQVALRESKDYAKPIEVTLASGKEFFWKWYLLSKDETETLVKAAIGAAKPQEQEPLPKESITPAKERKPRTKGPDDFLERVRTYLEDQHIEMLETMIIKKNTEIDFMLKVPHKIGTFTYYCKARNKKRCSDSDLSAAYTQGQIRKLPVIFLHTGTLSKKAEELLTTDLNINVATI